MRMPHAISVLWHTKYLLICVWYLNHILEPNINDHLVQPLVSSTPRFFPLNTSIVANPFVIPENITLTVQTPPGVPPPTFTVTGTGDTGTAYIKIDLFQLPQYAGSYTITLRHPAVSTAVIILFN